jgi:nickel/cobalt transporter (NicO) family protein
MKKNKLFFLSLLIMIIVNSICMPVVIKAQHNPFLSEGAKKNESSMQSVQSGSLFKSISKRIVPIQRKLNRKITYLSKRIKTDKKFVFFLIFFSFIYGIVHAVGPGHGKFIISSYFLSKKSKPIEAVLSGFVIAFTHGLSAIIIILVIFLLLHLPVLNSLTNTTRIISIISYMLIAGIGLFLFIKTIIDAIRNNQPYFEELPKIKNVKKFPNIPAFLPISFVTGLIPCPGAATIILFSLSTGAFMAGLLSIFAMSFGMGVTISLFALLALYTQKGILKSTQSKQAIQFKIIIGLRLIGTLMLFSMGIVLLSIAI